MGRASVKPDKSPYQLAREAAGLTREAASEALGTISVSTLERIESGTKKVVHPEDVLRMAEVYGAPLLCNRYCTHECAIGRVSVRELEPKSAAAVTLELVDTLNTLTKQKDRLIAIMADGQLTPDELPDFTAIRDQLDKLSNAVESLKLWASGKG